MSINVQETVSLESKDGNTHKISIYAGDGKFTLVATMPYYEEYDVDKDEALVWARALMEIKRIRLEKELGKKED